MSSTVAAATAHARTLQRERRERLFYVIACVVMLVGVAVGFHMFYLHGLNDAGQPVTQSASLVYVHGGASSWVVICVAKYLSLQFPTILITQGSVARIHPS